MLFSREKKSKARQSFCCHGCSCETLSIPAGVCVCVCVCVCVDSRPKAVTSSGINDTARCAPRPRPGLLQLTGFCKMWGQVFSRHTSEKKKKRKGKKRRRRRIQSYVSVLPESSGEDERSLLLITAAGWREQVDQSFIFHSSVTVKPRRGRRRRRRRRSELSRLPAGWEHKHGELDQPD